MLKILYLNGRYAPVLICDYCGKRIENAGAAAAVNSSPPADASKEGILLDVKHTHKGKCHDAVEQMMGSRGWEELTHHLRYLIHNTGLSPKDLQKWDDLDMEIGTL